MMSTSPIQGASIYMYVERIVFSLVLLFFFSFCTTMIVGGKNDDEEDEEKQISRMGFVCWELLYFFPEGGYPALLRRCNLSGYHGSWSQAPPFITYIDNEVIDLIHDSFFVSHFHHTVIILVLYDVLFILSFYI